MMTQVRSANNIYSQIMQWCRIFYSQNAMIARCVRRFCGGVQDPLINFDVSMRPEAHLPHRAVPPAPDTYAFLAMAKDKRGRVPQFFPAQNLNQLSAASDLVPNTAGTAGVY